MKTQDHAADLIARFPWAQDCREAIESAFHALYASCGSGGTLYFCGNGGSAADAEHWAAELLKNYRRKRRWPDDMAGKLPAALSDQLQPAVRAIPLTSFPSLQSAWLNDCDPAYNFAQLVAALAQPGDILIGLSTSGSARNVRNAFATAKALGLTTIALTGHDGGPLAAQADIAIRVPASLTHEVQEQHVAVYHCLCGMLEDALFRD